MANDPSSATAATRRRLQPERDGRVRCSALSVAVGLWVWLSMNNLNAGAAERGRDAKRWLELDATKRRQAAFTLLCGDVETENGVLVIEALHAELVHVVKAERRERVVTQDVISARIQLGGKLPQMNLGGEDWKCVSARVWVNVAAPQTELDNLGVVERRPMTKDARESLTAFDKFFRFIHEIRKQRLTTPISDPAPLTRGMQIERHRGVRCMGLVRHGHSVSDSCDPPVCGST